MRRTHCPSLVFLGALGLLALSSVAFAQTGQRRSETYDEYNTRRIREETANHRNNNPTFRGSKPSDNVDWSAWNSLIERYNARHATMPASASAPQVVSAAEKAAATARARDASAAQYQRELDNKNQGILNRHAALRTKGDRPATLRLGQIFDVDLVPPKNSYNGTKSEMAFRLYHEARLLNSPEQTACYLGIIPKLLDPAQETTPGHILGFLKWDRDMGQRYHIQDGEKLFADRCMTYLRSSNRKDWASDLLLALWYQHGDIGLGPLQAHADYYAALPSHLRGSHEKPIPPADRQAECLRLLKNVQAVHPSLGHYFIGAMTATYGTKNPLYLETLKKLAGPLVPLAGDKDNAYALVFQEEARLLLANLHLSRKVPNPSDEIALLLLRSCHGFSWAEARLSASNLIYRNQLERLHPLQEAVDDLESVFRDDPAAHYPRHKYRAAILRGLIKLTGETSSDRLRLPPDLAAAQAEFARAQTVKGLSDEQSEARCRELFVQAIGPDATMAAQAAQLLAADKRELWLVSTGLLRARGQGGLPRDPKIAMELFQRAIDLKLGSNSRIRGPDAIAVVEALHGLQKEKLLPAELGVVYETFLKGAARQNPMLLLPSLERRLARPEGAHPIAVTYRAILKDLEHIAATDSGLALRPVTMVRRAITDLKTPLEGELTLCLANVVAPGERQPWLDAFAAKGAARIQALAGIAQPTAQPLVAALQAREKIIRGATLAEAQAGLAELRTLATAGSLDAVRLLAREDTAWRSPEAPLDGDATKTNTAHHWSNHLVRRSKAFSLALFEGNFHTKPFPFRAIEAQAHCIASHLHGEPRAEPYLDVLNKALPPELAKTLGSSKFTTEEWDRFARVESALSTMNGEWWFLPPVARHKTACQVFFSADRHRPLIEFYLERELKELPAQENSARGNVHLLQTIYAARGASPAAKSEDAQRHFDEALKLQKAGGVLDPALLEEAQAELRKIPTDKR
jgi:hypothetical protein